MSMISDMVIRYLPTIVLLVAGFSLIVTEVYIPGFGWPGASGIVLLIAGIAVGANNFAEALGMVVVVVALLCIILTVTIRSVTKKRASHSPLVLSEVSYDGGEFEDMSGFVGKVGVAHTVLRPSGIGEFDGVKVDVVSDGEFIKKDEKIEVFRVEGNRVMVNRA